MKRIIAALITVVVGVSASAVGARPDDQKDFARVVDVVPIYANVAHYEPQQECWTETVRYEYPRQDSATPRILGALVGAAVGHNVARSKHGQGVGRVAGAILGASIGGDIARDRSQRDGEVEYRDEERCEMREKTYYEQVVVGYDVTYEYYGRTYQTRMDRDPGKRIRVAVDVRPVY